MWSKKHAQDVFVVKVAKGSAQVYSEVHKTWLVVHGDIVTFWNPKRDLWDKGELTDFLPPKYHTF